MLVVQALLTVGLVVVVVSTLHLLMRIDYATVTNARRVRFEKAIGEPISVDGLPERTREAVLAGDALFVFVAEGCPCDVALVAVSSLARVHSETQFVIWAQDPWPELFALQSARLRVVDDLAFQEQFGPTMYPYFVKCRKGEVLEFGIANLPEQVEALLAAGDPA